MKTDPTKPELPFVAPEEFGRPNWLDDDLDNIRAISVDDLTTLIRQIQHMAQCLKKETTQRVAQIDALLACLKDELTAED